jgi:hypothetical protein
MKPRRLQSAMIASIDLVIEGVEPSPISAGVE